MIVKYLKSKKEVTGVKHPNSAENPFKKLAARRVSLTRKERLIAAHRFVTTTHLGRVFKQETGMTVTQYINNSKSSKNRPE